MYGLTIRIRSDDTIRPNTNTLFGPLFGIEANTKRIFGIYIYKPIFVVILLQIMLKQGGSCVCVGGHILVLAVGVWEETAFLAAVWLSVSDWSACLSGSCVANVDIELCLVSAVRRLLC